MPSRDDIVQSFFDIDLIETSALLAATAGLTGDDVLLHRVRREIAARAHVLPRWLVALDEAEPVDLVFEMRHVLGDGDNIVFGVRLPGGHELCAAVYIDHNLGTLVKDASRGPGPAVGELVEMMRTTADDPDIALAEFDPADARVRITDAIELGAHHVSSTERPTPGRPAVRSSSGRSGCSPTAAPATCGPEWTDGDKQALTDRFFASSFGAAPGRRRPPRPARLAAVVRHRLRARRPAAVEPGGRRDRSGRLDPPQDRGRRAYLAQAPDLVRRSSG